MDGFGVVEEYALRAPSINQKFLTISDHGMLGAVPRQIKACDKINDKKGKDTLSPIFAVELYVNSLQPESDGLDSMQKFMAELNEEQKDECRKSSHLLAIAYNEEGYKNLVRLSSWAWTKGFYRRPRVNYEQLKKHKEGLFFTSCCYNSEVGRAFEKHGADAAFDVIERYIEMFGKEHYLLEIMLLDFEKQKPYNDFIIKAKEKYGLKMILTNDCLVDGTLVWTDKGFEEIESVKVGDQVLTHKNRYRPVEIKASRQLKNGEKVYRVKATAGSFSFEATGNHKIYVKRDGKYDWIPTSQLISGDFLVYSDFSSCDFFSKEGLKSINLKTLFQEDDLCFAEYENRKNFSAGLREQDGFYVSQRGFGNKVDQVKIPIDFTVDDDFCRVLGWYIAEGWSDTNSYQVGFALSVHEQDVADFLISYFSRFGIKSKLYKVSENGIALRFSSKVFNKLFPIMCGKKAPNKHLPYPDGKSWIGKFSKNQFCQILACEHFGDGSYLNNIFSFHSTSKKLIFEIASVLNAMGCPAIPSLDKKKNINWNQCWHLSFSGVAGKTLADLLCGIGKDSCSSSLWTHEDNQWLIKVQEVSEIDYNGNVHDFQIQEDHSFTANMAVVSNCHYCQEEDSHYQRLMLMVQTGRTLQEIQSAIDQNQMQDFFELQDSNLWMKSEEELNFKYLKDYSKIDPDIFKEAKRTTVEICNKAKGVQLDRNLKLPVLPDADEVLKEEIMRGFNKRGLPKNREYLNRIKEEYDLITRKGFSSYFLIQKKMTDEARRACKEILGFGDGSQAVGPGRGSGVGALTCYCLGLTSVDPIAEGLLFSRFMSEARGGRSIVLDFKNMDPLPPEDVFAN